MVENGDILATNPGDVRTFIMVVRPTTLFRRLHIVLIYGNTLLVRIEQSALSHSNKARNDLLIIVDFQAFASEPANL